MKTNLYLSLQKAFRILEFLAEAGSSNVSEVAEQLRLENSNASRLLKSLAELGYVSQPARRGQYQLGPRILMLAQGYREGDRLLKEAEPILAELAQSACATAHLGILVDKRAIVVAKVPSPERLQVASRVGGEIPLHASALGKILLASREDDDLAALLGKSPPAFTPHTITNLNALRKTIRQVRQQGYAFEAGEEHVGIGCIGAPVRDAANRWIAAISVAGPLQSTPFKLDQAHLALVLAKADALSNRLSSSVGPQSLQTKHELASRRKSGRFAR
jgi:DNA-binding IclR family transcriptional regulator